MFLSCHVYVSDWIHTQLKRPHGHTASLAKWLSVRLRTKWCWVRAQLQSLMRFYQYSKSKIQQYFSFYTSTVTLLNQWFGLINKEIPFPISRSEVLLWNCLAKKSWNFSRKMSVLEQDISKTGLQHRPSPILFLILEKSFCRAFCIFCWSLDAFLLFNKSLCCVVFQNSPLTRACKNSYSETSQKKGT